MPKNKHISREHFGLTRYYIVKNLHSIVAIIQKAMNWTKIVCHELALSRNGMVLFFFKGPIMFLSVCIYVCVFMYVFVYVLMCMWRGGVCAKAAEPAEP